MSPAAPATAPVVTGLGVVAPNGVNAESYWQAVLDGKSGIDLITRFDSTRYPVRLAGEVTGFVPTEHLPSRLVRQTSAMSHFGLIAADQALADAGVDPADVPEYEMAVFTANATGGAEFGQRELQNLWSKGPDSVGAYMSVAWFYAATTGQISIRHGMRGSCGVVVTEQAGSLDAVGQARRALRTRARLAVAGGSDSSLSPSALVAQLPAGRLTTAGDPAHAYRPFHQEADGYVPAEGGAMLVLETPEAARERGARPYGRITGYRATFDPPPGAGRPDNLAAAALGALAEAGLDPADVGLVIADAGGLPDSDRREAAALARVFGPRGVPVTVPKALTGRLYAGGPSLDVVAALLSIRDSVIPPTAGVEEPAPRYEIDLVVGEARPASLDHVLVLARGHGGFNAAVVVSGP